jgi:hypothetical protein
LAEIKEKESDPNLESNSKQDMGNNIVNAEHSVIIAITNIQPNKLEELEEGECHFYSHRWVKGNPIHFIVDDGRQKNLILTEVIKILTFQMIPPPTIHHRLVEPGMRPSCQPIVGRDLHINQQR